ncbi:unnamed protein product [Penicillium bialowiezense]
MSKRSAVDFSWQETFQKECLSFLRQLENDALFLRENADDHSFQTTGVAYRKRLREAGLEMVEYASNSPLVVERRSYWFIQAMADQSEFEDECDLLEAQLDDLAKKVFSRQVENLWVAGILETTAANFEEGFHLDFMNRKC